MLGVFVTHIFDRWTGGPARKFFRPVNAQRGESVLIRALLAVLFNNVSTRHLKYDMVRKLKYCCKIYTNFNSKAPTFFNKSPTIPRADILKI